MKGFSTENRYLLWVVILFSCFAAGMVFWINYQMKTQSLREAHEKARIILDRNLATHTYFTEHLKPSVFKIATTGFTEGYFDPTWMSSSYAVRIIGDYFREIANSPYYYKECAVNARSPKNEADPLEREALHIIRTSPEKNQWEGIREFEDGKYYVLIRRSEVMEKSCLKCHGRPEEAPPEMIALYGAEKGFDKPVGELLSVASIRIPLDTAYRYANKITRDIVLGFFVMIVILFFCVHFLNQRLFIRPLGYFRDLSRLISSKERGVAIPIPRGAPPVLSGEWQELDAAFKEMTESISTHETELNRTIQNALSELVENRQKFQEEVASHQETALKLKRESDIVKNINIGMHIYRLSDLSDDRTLILIDANPATEILLGIPCRDVIGKTIDDNFPEIRERGIPKFYADVVRTGAPMDLGDFYYEDTRVKPAWFHVNAFPLPDQCMGVAFDNITMRKRIEDELAKQKNALQALFDHMLNAFAVHRIIVDDAGVPIDYEFLDVNPAFEKFTGVNRQNILGKRVTEVFPGIEKSPFDWIGAYGRVALTGEPVQFEQYFEPHDHWYKIAAYQPMPMHFVVTFEDITHRKKAEKENKILETQLRQVQKIEAIGVLAGGIAHDFNNILFPIIGFAEMIRDDLPEDSPLRENAIEIISGAIRARDLVRQILAFSRQEEGRVRPINVQIILKEVIRLVRATLPSTITIRQFIDPECGLILNDPTRIHQLIMNLVTNAFHAMEADGGILTLQLTQVTLDAETALSLSVTPGSYVRITVSDTGVGMDAITLQKMFDPYFTTKGEGKGTGLGLSVVYGIVKQSGGSLSVASKKEEGSRFDIYFPVQQALAEPEEKSDDSPLFEGYAHVLLIDDEFPVLNIGKQILERLGCRVTVRTSSIEALELFKNRPDDFQMVMTDMTMPNMTGDTLAKEVRKIRPEIPIVICTGYSATLTPSRARELGIDAFIHKPILASEVSRILYQVLSPNAENSEKGGK